MTGDGVCVYVDENNLIQKPQKGQTIVAVNGVPKLQNTSEYYFAFAAFTIGLMTTSNPQLEDNYRRQRVAEMLMILKYLGFFKVGLMDKAYGTIDASAFVAIASKDLYADAISVPIFRYDNTSSAGVPAGGTLSPNTSAVSVTFQSQVQKTDSNGWVLPDTVSKLKQLATLSGVTEVNISQTVQTSKEVAEYLFNLEESGTHLQYAPPAQRVVYVYYFAKIFKLSISWDADGKQQNKIISQLSKTYKADEQVITADKDIIIGMMLEQIRIEGAYSVSKHAAESIDQYHLRQVLDVSNTGSKPVSALPVFKSRLKEIVKQQDNKYSLASYIEATPKNEDGMHLEFSNVNGSGGAPSNALPQVKFNGINNATYKSESGWASPFIADANRVKRAAQQ